MRAVVDHQGQPLDERQSPDLHGRQPHRLGERQLGVRQQRERQVQPLDGFALIGGVLRGQPEHARRARLDQHLVQVAESAALRRAAPGTRDHVPVVDERGLAGLARARIGEHDDAAGELRQRDLRAVGGRQRDVRHLGALQMPRRAVVHGRRDPRPVDGQQIGIGGGWHEHLRCRAPGNDSCRHGRRRAWHRAPWAGALAATACSAASVAPWRAPHASNASMTRLPAPLRRRSASVMTHSAIATPSPTTHSAVAAGRRGRAAAGRRTGPARPPGSSARGRVGSA